MYLVHLAFTCFFGCCFSRKKNIERKFPWCIVHRTRTYTDPSSASLFHEYSTLYFEKGNSSSSFKKFSFTSISILNSLYFLLTKYKLCLSCMYYMYPVKPLRDACTFLHRTRQRDRRVVENRVYVLLSCQKKNSI